MTPAGALAFCDYLTDKGYAPVTQIKPWRTAIQQVFETVEGDGWEQVDLSGVDLDDYLLRFRTLAAAKYKAESITTYGKRLRNALDAQAHFHETGHPPTFRQRVARAPARPVAQARAAAAPEPSHPAPAATGLHDFQYPLSGGQVALLRLPPRLKPDDVLRLNALIRTLQDDSPEPRQIPQHTGEDELAA